MNTDASWPTLVDAEARVLGIQHELHRQTTPDVCRMGSWRAGCGESRMSGSEGGPVTPTDWKVDRALWPDPYYVLDIGKARPNASTSESCQPLPVAACDNLVKRVKLDRLLHLGGGARVG